MNWTLKGVVTPNPDGSFLVDLHGTLDGIDTFVPARRTRSSTVSATPETDIQDEIDCSAIALGDEVGALAAEMVELMASKNKSGEVALSRALRQVYRPLMVAVERHGRDAMAHGMRESLRRGVENVNYAKTIAEGYRKPAELRPVAPGSSRYDFEGEN